MSTFFQLFCQLDKALRIPRDQGSAQRTATWPLSATCRNPGTGEGWGLTTNGTDLFMSDGTAEIRVLDGGTLQEKRRLRVHDGSAAVTRLNELEFVEGEIYANVWQTDRIARISPRTGKVLGWIDLKGLLSPVYRLDRDAVLNGIAYDSDGKRLFVTGKLWPSVFEIRLVRQHPK